MDLDLARIFHAATVEVVSEAKIQTCRYLKLIQVVLAAISTSITSVSGLISI